MFVFGDFDIHHKDCLTYSGRADRFGELCYNFSISNELNKMVNFHTRIPVCDFQIPAILDIFISSDSIICSIMDFPGLGHFDYVVVLSRSKWGVPFHRIAYDYFYAD